MRVPSLVFGVRCQLLALLAAFPLALPFGLGAVAAVAASAAAVILPEAMYAALAGRILSSDSSATGKVAKGYRARMLKLLTTVAFLAVSLRAVGPGTAEVAFWALTVLVLTLLPGWAHLAAARAGDRA